MGLLPEVNRRRLYEKRGSSSVFEFAKKLAGLSEEQVRTALNLDRNFENKPILKSLLVNGEVSINKLVRITSVVTKENEVFWANQVKILPNRALETLVKDEKLNRINTPGPNQVQNKNSLHKPIFDDSELHVQLEKKENNSTDNQPKVQINLHNDPQLSKEVKQKLFELQQKGIDINQLILTMLQKRELEIAQEKEQLTKEVHAERAATRYIPIKIKKLIRKEHGTKCSIKTCSKPAEQIHHTQRFSLSHVHDPHYLAPLCKEHHVIAHSIDLKFQAKRTFSD